MLYADWEKVMLVKTFLKIMNLPPPMTEKNYSKIAWTIHKAVKTVAGSCMSDTAKEIKTITWFLRGSQVLPQNAKSPHVRFSTLPKNFKCLPP